MDAKRLEEIRARHQRDEKALAMSGDRPVQWHGTQPHADRGTLLAALDEARAQLRALARWHANGWRTEGVDVDDLAQRIMEADDGT